MGAAGTLRETGERLLRVASSMASRAGVTRPDRRAAALRSAAAVRDTLVSVALDPVTAASRLLDLTGPELDAVLHAGAEHGLGTALVSGLHEAGLPVPGWLETHRFDTTLRRGQIMEALGAISPALTAAGVPWVVLKGPVIACSSDSSELREYGDLDLLVPGPALPGTLEVLEDIGTDAINRNWRAYVDHGVAEFPVHVMGTPLDLHWHLIGLGRLRKRFGIDTDELLERRIESSAGDVRFPRLDPEDNTINVTLHAGLSGATRIGWLRDVHLTIDGTDLDWGVLVDRCHRYGAAPIVGQVLDRCRSVLGSPIPADVPGRLAPAPALRIRRQLDAGMFLSRKDLDPSFSGFLVAISRAGATETAACAWETLEARIETRAGRPRRWSAYDPEGPLYWARASGGKDGLRSYLEFAARGQ